MGRQHGRRYGQGSGNKWQRARLQRHQEAQQNLQNNRVSKEDVNAVLHAGKLLQEHALPLPQVSGAKKPDLPSVSVAVVDVSTCAASEHVAALNGTCDAQRSQTCSSEDSSDNQAAPASQVGEPLADSLELKVLDDLEREREAELDRELKLCLGLESDDEDLVEAVPENLGQRSATGAADPSFNKMETDLVSCSSQLPLPTAEEVQQDERAALPAGAHSYCADVVEAELVEDAEDPQQRDAAARTIQAAWRAFVDRRPMRALASPSTDTSFQQEDACTEMGCAFVLDYAQPTVPEEAGTAELPTIKLPSGGHSETCRPSTPCTIALDASSLRVLAPASPTAGNATEASSIPSPAEQSAAESQAACPPPCPPATSPTASKEDPKKHASSQKGQVVVIQLKCRAATLEDLADVDGVSPVHEVQQRQAVQSCQQLRLWVPGQQRVEAALQRCAFLLGCLAGGINRLAQAAHTLV